MFNGKRLILYELNEVPLRIIDWFAQRQPRSSLARLSAEGRVFETLAEDDGHLSPWMTWPTLHRGVTNRQHGILDFGQNLTEVNREFPSIWELLARGGRKVGLFGSLHSYPLPTDVENYAFYVPDTFAAGPECFPETLETFQKFNLAMALRSGRNVTASLPLREAASFLAAAPGLGLRGRTAGKIARQVIAERIKPQRVVRRRTSQVQIAFDFFLHDLKRTKPDAAFFFTNHVASSMHRYWPATFPRDYATRHWTAAWETTWKDEIFYVMQEANAQIGDLLAFVNSDPRYVLAITSSMGQAAIEGQANVETQLNFSDIGRFMRLLGAEPDDWRSERAMAPLYMITVRPDLVSEIGAKLGQVAINGKTLDFIYRGEGVYRIELGQANLQANEINITLDGRPIAKEAAGMVNLRIQDEAGSNAYHVPQGSLIVYDPERPAVGSKRGQRSTLEVAPAILANFGVPRPHYMVEPASLV